MSRAASLIAGFRRGAAIRRKEWAQIWLDPSTIGLVVVLPLLLMFLFGSAISLDTSATRVMIIDQDSSALSEDLAASFSRNRYFDAVAGDSIKAAGEALDAGNVRAFIVIPDGFGRTLGQGRAPDLLITTDGSLPNSAAFIASYGEGIVRNWSIAQARTRGIAIEPPITLNPRFRFNPGLQSRYQLVPGAVAIVMAMIGTMLTALIMAREYERGTMEGLLSTPISASAIVLNKLAPYFMLGMASMALCVAVAVWGYGLPFNGSILALFAISAAFLTAALGQGLLISAGTKNQFVSTQYALLSGFLPSLLLSGFLFEIDSMPQPIQWLTYIVPASYLIPSLQTVFLVGDVWSLFLPHIAVLCVMGAFFFWRATKAIRRVMV